jgi:hypothetical protein
MCVGVKQVYKLKIKNCFAVLRSSELNAKIYLTYINNACGFIYD